MRTGAIDVPTLHQMVDLFFEDLSDGRFQVVAVDHDDFNHAEELIRSHAVRRGLRTLDALQLAVALRLFQDSAISALVASDKTLCEVAGLEGIPVVNPLD